MPVAMFYEHAAGEICTGCKQWIRSQDWTCPRCGQVLDRYLFGTVTAKSVTGGDKEAFQTGYDACMSQWNVAGTVELGEYRPTRGHETAYRAGWQRAADRIESKAERQRGRRRGLVLLGSGTGLTAVGGPIAYFGFRHGAGEKVFYMALLFGLLNIAFGIVALISGHSDE